MRSILKYSEVIPDLLDILKHFNYNTVIVRVYLLVGKEVVIMEKKNILTYAGLQKLEEELHDLKVNKRKEVAEKIKEAREQGDLSENAEYGTY